MLKKKQYECATCKHIGPAKKVTPGSILIELVLWLTIIFGFLYSLRRMSARKKVCSRCGSTHIRPVEK